MYNKRKGIWANANVDTVASYIQNMVKTLDMPKLLNKQFTMKVIEQLKGLISLNKLPTKPGMATPQGFFSYATATLEKHSPYNYCIRYVPHEISTSGTMSPITKRFLYNIANNDPTQLIIIRTFSSNWLKGNSSANCCYGCMDPQILVKVHIVI